MDATDFKFSLLKNTLRSIKIIILIHLNEYFSVVVLIQLGFFKNHTTLRLKHLVPFCHRLPSSYLRCCNFIYKLIKVLLFYSVLNFIIL